jgi:hypothetical protein
MIGKRACPNSTANTAFARARKASAAARSIFPGSNLRQSHQSLPPAARMESFRSATTVDSQNPFSLSALGAIKCRGARPPRRTRVPAVLDVPLRCIPSTKTAIVVRRSSASWSECWTVKNNSATPLSRVVSRPGESGNDHRQWLINCRRQAFSAMAEAIDCDNKFVIAGRRG